MRRTRIAEQVLRAAGPSASRQQYVCRSCLAKAAAARQYHTTNRLNAEEPLFKRLQNALLGRRKKENFDVAKDDKVEEEASMIQLDGVEYEVAARLNPRGNKVYQPASSWDGLETVGGKAWVKKRLDMGEQYVGFRAQDLAALEREHWIKLIHHIAVEVTALRAAGRNVHDVCNERLGESIVDSIANARLVNRTARLTLKAEFRSLEDKAKVLNAIQESSSTTQEPGALKEPGNLRTELLTITSAERADYEDVVVEDPVIKLAIYKRALQLTGKRIPDFHLSTSRTLGDLINAFASAPKPKKLTETPQVAKLAEQVSNVRVHDRKRTHVHKEREIGRWKVIEEELAARNLPLFGTRWEHAKEGVRLLEK